LTPSATQDYSSHSGSHQQKKPDRKQQSSYTRTEPPPTHPIHSSNRIHQDHGRKNGVEAALNQINILESRGATITDIDKEVAVEAGVTEHAPKRSHSRRVNRRHIQQNSRST